MIPRRHKRARHVVEDLGVELLPPEPGSLIAPHDLVEKGGRQVGAVFGGRAAGHHDLRVGEQRADQLDRARRRRHDRARVGAEPQPEHQHVPRGRIAPRRKLVAPGEIMLRTAQPVRLVGRVGRRNRAVGPGQAVLRWFVNRPLARQPDIQNAAFAFDHDVAGVERGWRHQCDVPGQTGLDQCPNEFGAGAGLAEAAPGKQQPDPPVAGRRCLRGPRPPGYFVF